MHQLSSGETTSPLDEAQITKFVVPYGVPEVLRRRPQWVVWRYEKRGGEWTKVPYTPGANTLASTSDLMTWRTFPEALNAVEGGGYDGVGFVFCSGDPFTGIDLDKCRDPETGELEAWAAKILAAFTHAYKEVSPSGRGVHIIVRGKASGRKRDELEIYSERRFFTMTGKTI
jgi:putative DNA primase/helicase